MSFFVGWYFNGLRYENILLERAKELTEENQKVLRNEIESRERTINLLITKGAELSRSNSSLSLDASRLREQLATSGSQNNSGSSDANKERLLECERLLERGIELLQRGVELSSKVSLDKDTIVEYYTTNPR